MHFYSFRNEEMKRIGWGWEAVWFSFSICSHLVLVVEEASSFAEVLVGRVFAVRICLRMLHSCIHFVGCCVDCVPVGRLVELEGRLIRLLWRQFQQRLFRTIQWRYKSFINFHVHFVILCVLVDRFLNLKDRLIFWVSISKFLL